MTTDLILSYPYCSRDVPSHDRSHIYFFICMRVWSSYRSLAFPIRMASSYNGPWPAHRIRDEFFAYFRSKDHTFVPSSSTIPYDDPTLLFANAGMNQVRRISLFLVTPYSFDLVQVHLSRHCRSQL